MSRVPRIRIRDVAAEAGVSATTTSFVLNGRGASIPEVTRQRVMEVARRLGYRPNASARALATGRTRRLGVVINTPHSLVGRGIYHVQVLSGIMSALPHLDYNLLLHSADYPDWQALCDDILTGAADGVLLIGREAPDPLTAALLEAQFPTVCVSYHVDHPDCYAVDCDNESGLFEAIRYLLSLGHRRILAFAGDPRNSWEQERRNGALRAVREAGLPEETLRVYSPAPGDWNGDVRSLVDRLRAVQPNLTAIYCDGEEAARTLAERLPEAGLRVPDDISLISFNSTEISARSQPPITSVWQPLADIGAEAARLLVQRLDGKELPQHIHRLPIRLDLRESCAPPL